MGFCPHSYLSEWGCVRVVFCPMGFGLCGVMPSGVFLFTCETSSSCGMCLSWNFFVLPDFRIFWCTTCVSDGFVLALGDQNTFWPCYFIRFNIAHKFIEDIINCIHWISSGEYYGLLMSMSPLRQCVKIFLLPL